MSDNLNNEIKRSLFYEGSVTVTTTGGDITPNLIQPAQTSGLEKYNLDQRDDLNILLYAVTGTVVAGATLTVKYYNRVPNAISDAILLATETKTLAAITVGNYLATEFTNAALELADYFTVECVLKQAVGSDYTVTGNVIVKKKNNVAYQNEDVSFDDVTANSLKLNGATSGQSTLQAPATGGVTNTLPSIAGTLVAQPLTGQTAPVSETRATATYTGAANAGFILYSKLLGTAGNAITYTITTAADDNLAITVVGNAITIALANTTSSKNTATLVKAAIEAKAEANALVAVTLTGTGAGVVATQAVASLTGGLNGTTGYLGQVVFDTAGVEWKMIWTNGTVYYWSPEGFPAVNTEYASHVEGGVVVYKYRYSVNNVGTTTPLTVNHGIANIEVFKPIGSDCYVGSGYNSIRKGFYTATNHYIQFTVTTTQIVTSFASPTFNSTAVSTEFYYTKTA